MVWGGVGCWEVCRGALWSVDGCVAGCGLWGDGVGKGWGWGWGWRRVE